MQCAVLETGSIFLVDSWSRTLKRMDRSTSWTPVSFCGYNDDLFTPIMRGDSIVHCFHFISYAAWQIKKSNHRDAIH